MSTSHPNDYASTAPGRDEVDRWQGPAVIEFGTDWCGHCQAAQPLIAQVLAEYPKVRHVKLEDGKGRPLGRSYQVKLWPTLIFLRDGQEAARLVRPTDSESLRRAMAEIHA